jgi:hypothetical protein
MTTLFSSKRHARLSVTMRAVGLVGCLPLVLAAAGNNILD